MNHEHKLIHVYRAIIQLVKYTSFLFHCVARLYTDAHWKVFLIVGRHDMQHFVKVMHGYIALQVTEVTWHQFQTELNATVKDLDSLYDSHNKFINRCLLR